MTPEFFLWLMLGRGRGNVQGCSLPTTARKGKEAVETLESWLCRVHEALRNSAGTTGPSLHSTLPASCLPPPSKHAVVEEFRAPTTPESLTSLPGPTLISPFLSLSSSPSIAQGRVHLLESCAARTLDTGHFLFVPTLTYTIYFVPGFNLYIPFSTVPATCHLSSNPFRFR